MSTASTSKQQLGGFQKDFDALCTEIGRVVVGQAETIQNVLYEVGKRHPFEDLRAWFGCLYQVLLGQAEGPRFGQFVALYGIAETIGLIEAALARAST